jgi:hypothetical protein
MYSIFYRLKCLIVLVFLLILPACFHHSSYVHKVSARKLKMIETFSMPEPGKPITILVHGTRLPPPILLVAPALMFGVATPSGLHKVGDVSFVYYFKYIANGLSRIDPKQFPSENMYLFGWSGMLDGDARRLAGELLYHYIKRIRSDRRFDQTPITIITMSHGASVGLNVAAAAEKNHDESVLVDRLVLLCGPVMDSTHDYAYSPIFKNVINIFSTGDALQASDPQRLDDLSKSTKTFFSRRTFSRQTPKLVQAEVAFKKCKLGHIDFCFAPFYEKLPALLDVLEHGRSGLNCINGVYNVNLSDLNAA